MTLYEVELRVEYTTKRTIQAPDEDAAVESAVESERRFPLDQAELPDGAVQFYGIRTVTRDELEDA